MNRMWWYVILGVGLTTISLPLFAQGLFPGVEIRSMSNWLVTFGVGAIFTVLWYMVKRWIDAIDSLQKSVYQLTTETKLHRQEASGYCKDINILKRRQNITTNWIHHHEKLHAKCTQCPDNTNTYKDSIYDANL